MPDLHIISGTLHCSFCDKSQHEVRRLILGPKPLAICDECTDLCAKIVAEAGAEEAITKRMAERGERIASRQEVEALAWMRTWSIAAPALAPNTTEGRTDRA
ncbi:Hypothetical protein MexAM1_META1p3936 [Methylorubrum extorquens AM1]|uniref:ClpX-type ZB domain-containing protein n=1 Tax=Methylorubrum extorquens (strain ATCC 14718 / DSM 1338 / JCM 2805 / NCIMB 9133 / AM1) TaxID=272630 RepID=C5B0N2_METEA|nr:Hypothetical protein MexAM1_META1p3936 [Methylorubrum extorquens AM1]MCP1545369.1 hypothetical protein [Methylorubrum extorquens]MCP1587284.1 hypothetical protein [Methylorubrum extorquens]